MLFELRPQMRMLLVTRLIFRYAEPHSLEAMWRPRQGPATTAWKPMASPGRADVHKGKINSPRVRGILLWIWDGHLSTGAVTFFRFDPTQAQTEKNRVGMRLLVRWRMFP